MRKRINSVRRLARRNWMYTPLLLFVALATMAPSPANKLEEDFDKHVDDFTNHAGSTSAHHTKYTDGDAEAAIIAADLAKPADHGGVGNLVSGANATIGGGNDNTASGNRSTISGGSQNLAGGEISVIGGGLDNEVGSVPGSVIGGGLNNFIRGRFSTISGGAPTDLSTASTRRQTKNHITDDYGTIGGGGNNRAGNDEGTISDAAFATVGGGEANTASGPHSTVGGGEENVAGRSVNNVFSSHATVAGGNRNQAIGSESFIGGGRDNLITQVALLGAILGGHDNQLQASNGFAIGSGNIVQDLGIAIGLGGSRLFPGHKGAILFSDAGVPGGFGIFSQAANEFAARATGGVRFETAVDTSNLPNTPPTAGVELPSGASAWLSISDRNSKENFADIDYEKLLEKLADIPIQTWNYKSQESSIRHMGPMAQDVYEAFGLGEDELKLSTIDMDGMALAAIKGLNQKLTRKDTTISKLEARIAKLEHMFEAMALQE